MMRADQTKLTDDKSAFQIEIQEIAQKYCILYFLDGDQHDQERFKKYCIEHCPKKWDDMIGQLDKTDFFQKLYLNGKSLAHRFVLARSVLHYYIQIKDSDSFFLSKTVQQQKMNVLWMAYCVLRGSQTLNNFIHALGQKSNSRYADGFFSHTKTLVNMVLQYHRVKITVGKEVAEINKGSKDTEQYIALGQIVKPGS